MSDESFFKYEFTTCVEKNAEIRLFFGECSYVGCYGLNHVLLHFQNKLYMVNILPFIPAFVAAYCQTNKLTIKKVKASINLLK